MYVPHEHAAVLGEARQHRSDVLLQPLLLPCGHGVLVELQHDLLTLRNERTDHIRTTRIHHRQVRAGKVRCSVVCRLGYRAVLPAGVVHPRDGQRLYSVVRVRAVAVVEED